MMTDREAHDAALARARDLLARPMTVREAPERMHTPRDDGEDWTDWPAARQPTMNVGKMLDRRIDAKMDTLAAAVGDRLGKASKRTRDETRAALAERDERIDALERRIAMLESEKVLDMRHHLKGGTRDAA